MLLWMLSTSAIFSWLSCLALLLQMPQALPSSFGKCNFSFIKIYTIKFTLLQCMVCGRLINFLVKNFDIYKS